jgi:hypothetical protein
MTTIIPINDYSPIFQGDTGNPFVIFVAQANGFRSILGATITMHMQSVTNPALIQACDPTKWTIDPLDTGKAAYTYQTADVATAGSWYMWINITIGGKPLHVDDGEGNPIILVIKPLPIGV